MKFCYYYTPFASKEKLSLPIDYSKAHFRNNYLWKLYYLPLRFSPQVCLLKLQTDSVVLSAVTFILILVILCEGRKDFSMSLKFSHIIYNHR